MRPQNVGLDDIRSRSWSFGRQQSSLGEADDAARDTSTCVASGLAQLVSSAAEVVRIGVDLRMR
jgi:hypothetical protein